MLQVHTTTFYVYNRVACSEAGFLWVLWMNNSTTEHDTMKLITSVHSESTVHSIDVLFSKNTWHFVQTLPLRLQCTQSTKHTCTYLSRLTILSWIDQCKQFCHSKCCGWGIFWVLLEYMYMGIFTYFFPFSHFQRPLYRKQWMMCTDLSTTIRREKHIIQWSNMIIFPLQCNQG